MTQPNDPRQPNNEQKQRSKWGARFPLFVKPGALANRLVSASKSFLSTMSGVGPVVGLEVGSGLFSGYRPTRPDYGNLPLNRFRSEVDYLGAYSSIGSVYTCVSTISSSIAGLPLEFVDQSGKTIATLGQMRSEPGSLAALLENPNEYQDDVALRETIAAHLELCGNAIVLMDNLDGQGRPESLFPLNPAYVTLAVSPTQGLLGYLYQPPGSGTRMAYGKDEILHFKTLNPSSIFWGQGTLQALASNLNTEIDIGDSVQALYRNGAVIPGAFVAKEYMDEGSFKRLKEQLMEEHTGSQNFYKPLLLDGGLDWKSMTVGHTDLGTMDIRKLNREEIYMAFGVPVSQAGNQGHANVKNDHLTDVFWVTTIGPKVKHIEVAFRKLTRRYDDRYSIKLPLPIKVEEQEMLSNVQMVDGLQSLSTSEKRKAIKTITGDQFGWGNIPDEMPVEAADQQQPPDDGGGPAGMLPGPDGGSDGGSGMGGDMPGDPNDLPLADSIKSAGLGQSEVSNLVDKGILDESYLGLFDSGSAKEDAGPGRNGPGSRGGDYWVDDNGKVRYGDKPKGRKSLDVDVAFELLENEKAWRRGGGMGGRGQGVKRPGSRGGHPWTDAHGNVRYGPKPTGTGRRAGHGQTNRKPQGHGTRAVRTGVGGGSGKPKWGELRPGYRIKPQTAASRLQTKKRMLSELDRTFKTGIDPHGNKLDAKTLNQVNMLATSLRTELHGFKALVLTDDAKAQILDGFDQLVDQYEQAFTADLVKVLEQSAGDFIQALNQTDEDREQQVEAGKALGISLGIQRLGEMLADRLTRVAVPHLTQAIVGGFLDATLNTLGPANHQSVEKEAKARAAQMARTVVDNTKAAVTKIAASDKPQTEKVQEVKNLFDQDRAQLIAETEAVSALNYGKKAGYTETGQTNQMWVSQRDHRVRKTHKLADGQVSASTFEVGGYEMKYPGDPDAPAKERIGCRCTLVGTSEPETRASEKAMQPQHTGVMVAFYLPPDVAEELALDYSEDGEDEEAGDSETGSECEAPEELHLTLAYLGDSTQLDEDLEFKLYQVVKGFAREQAPVTGQVSGIGLFNSPGDDQPNAFYASFDSPDLPVFRNQLIDALVKAGIPVTLNHGFTPHITLAYVLAGEALPTAGVPNLDVTFETITVKWGDNRVDIPLKANAKSKE